MYWECGELQASESYPYGFPFEEYAIVSFKSLNPFYLGIQSMEERLKRAYEIWGQAVLEYTATKLTKASDKLVAISAVARALQPVFECEYIAGHWKKDLVRQLAWKGLT